MLKRLPVALLVLMMLACREDTDHPDTLYGEWQWVMTTFDSRGTPITAQEMDTTYYYRFTAAGQLEIRDGNETLTQRHRFVVIEDPEFNRIEIDSLDEPWGYVVRNDTLRLWEPASLLPRLMLFRRHRYH